MYWDRDYSLELINGAVTLSEAKHLCLFLLADRSKFDPRFFSRDCGIRMTVRDRFTQSSRCTWLAV